jgi:alkylated DNA nucleotide flippase Atl1
MLQQEDIIVDIPENRIKFFGGTGKMLLPSPATLATLIEKVPEHKLITTELLQKKLAGEFKVQGVCPVTTRNALKVVAQDLGQTAYWRVIKQNGELMAYFPDGVEGHAARLREEGFTIDTKGKAPKVTNFKESLVSFSEG